MCVFPVGGDPVGELPLNLHPNLFTGGVSLNSVDVKKKSTGNLYKAARFLFGD